MAPYGYPLLEHNVGHKYTIQKSGSCYSLHNPPFVDSALADFFAVRDLLFERCSGDVILAYESQNLSRHFHGLCPVLSADDRYGFECVGSSEKTDERRHPDIEAKCALQMVYARDKDVLIFRKDMTTVSLELSFALRDDDTGALAFSLLQRLRKVSLVRFPDGFEVKSYTAPSSITDFRRSRLRIA